MVKDLRTAICDSCKKDLMYVYKVIDCAFKQYEIMCSVQLYTHFSELLKDNNLEPFDVIFLELVTPEMDGMEVAAKIKERQNTTELIFVTNYDELVYKAYRFKAIGYIRKKYLETEINEIIEVLIQSISRQNRYIIVKTSGVIIKYNVKDVIYMKSDDHYVDIISSKGKCSVRDTLNNLEKMYSHYGFIRTHSRYLVNFRYIGLIEKNVLILNDNQQLPISRNRIGAVKKMLQLYASRIQ